MTMRLLLATLLLSGVLSIGTARAAESYDGCIGFIDTVPATITTQGTWCLRRDLSTAIASGAAITIAANNVTIDCNDFKLGGLAAGIATNASGIAATGRQNTTVRNCNVRGFLRGTDLLGDGSRIEGNRFEANTFVGIRLVGDNTVVRDNLVNDTGGRRKTYFPGDSSTHYIFGIVVQGGSHVAGNTVSGIDAGDDASPTTLIGIVAYTGDGTLIERNLVRGMVGSLMQVPHGIVVGVASNAMVIDNRVSALTSTRGTAIGCEDGNVGVRGNLAWGFGAFFNTNACSAPPDGSNHRF